MRGASAGRVATELLLLLLLTTPRHPHALRRLMPASHAAGQGERERRVRRKAAGQMMQTEVQSTLVQACVLRVSAGGKRVQFDWRWRCRRLRR